MTPKLVFYAPTERWRLVDVETSDLLHECESFTEACGLLRDYGVTPATGHPADPVLAEPAPERRTHHKKR